ncbi:MULTISPECIES: Mrp/NBP35 family ATP-binding protein [Clostridium]|uniref:Iron-sulfur cluster carrier protein n=3 Tax=Clostridium TaxID=1485 RepID=D8GKT8_CLOLD|nr:MULTISPECIES: Mrp/NBP35 family ATP-binding protein [Clostridium]ADK13271.1 predicted nucleotide-binding protein [Clostridium ljungdahlii DSM 13528]AGY76495.1 Mrp/NBP35 family ATP-binding protein [Clostridium autoethanogenum DSM 10061]ALU36656.1 ATPase-like ParA/MinD [Clostridium autoethanogenum DSM 10061]OAA88889.1 Adenylyl-sulfate kinase [Clostridium ljungdahlii DSM 13528]OVY50654.1 Adenylyl-sulfate kinase [Clostridium autoethanogenum]
MSNCDGCSSKSKCSKEDKGGCKYILPKYGNVKHIIGIMSGKGGVGKSTVTGIMASKLRNSGYKVGVLDGDITGPSMPRFFGINDKRADILQVGESEEIKFSPVESSSGIKVISLNLLTEEEEQPVIWRAPMITGVLKQMYSDTSWGELDYLLIDMPPGTGDVALTVMQEIPMEGVIIVSTPQDMVSMIVKKVVIMAEDLKVNILGVVENMSYVKCGKCGEKVRLFSENSAKEQADYLGLELLAEMPINSDLVKNMEAKKAEEYISKSLEYNDLLNNFIKKLK